MCPLSLQSMHKNIGYYISERCCKFKMENDFTVKCEDVIALFKDAYTEAWVCITTTRDVRVSPFHGLFKAICLIGQKENFEYYCCRRIAISEHSDDPHYIKHAHDMKTFLNRHAGFFPFFPFEDQYDVAKHYTEDSTLEDLWEDNLINTRIYNAIAFHCKSTAHYNTITIRDIQTLTLWDLHSIRNFGTRSIEMLRKAMHDIGFPFAWDDEI